MAEVQEEGWRELERETPCPTLPVQRTLTLPQESKSTFLLGLSLANTKRCPSSMTSGREEAGDLLVLLCRRGHTYRSPGATEVPLRSAACLHPDECCWVLQ